MNSSNNFPPYLPHPDFTPESLSSPRYVEDHFGQRLSNKEERSVSPSVMSPGLQSVKADEGDKEVAPFRPQPMLQTWRYQDQPGDQRKGRTVCGIPIFWFCILLAAIVAIAVALGVGLGVGLQENE